jgi:hypothetical protein
MSNKNQRQYFNIKTQGGLAELADVQVTHLNIRVYHSKGTIIICRWHLHFTVLKD